MKLGTFVTAIAVLLMVGAANAAVVTVTGVTGHDGGNWGPWHGHLSDALNGNGSYDFGTGADHIPGMDISADPGDPSQWIYTHANGWKNEYDANSRLAGTGDPGNGVDPAINNKIGWMVLDFGSVLADLENMYVWGQRDGQKVTESVKDYNVYYSSGVGIDTLPAMPQSKQTTGDYDFSSGDWTQIGSTRTLALSSAPWGPQDTASLGGVSAQYLALEIITAHGVDNRVGLAQVEITRDIGPTDPCDFEPDGDCDIDDVDLMVTQGDLTIGLAVPPTDAKFDLDGDSDVDTDDYNKWLTDAATVNGHGSPYRGSDTDLDRDVDITDFNALASAFDPGAVNAATNGQSKGNSDADNDVDITDFNRLASNFSPGGYDGAAAAVAEADPGQVDLVVDVETGEVTLDGNNAAISGLQVFSAGNSLLATDFTADVLQFVISTNTSTYAEGAFANMGVDGLISLGMMYDALVDARDVTFEYTMIGQPTVQGRVLYIPEPASLVLMGMGGLLVLRRRRRA